MQLDVVPNQDFLNFISKLGPNNSLPNLELILNLEKNFPGIFVKIMSDFSAVKLCRGDFDNNGRPVELSWEETFKKFYLKKAYLGVTKENEDIAEIFNSRGLSQELFDKAKVLRKEAEKRKVEEHILGHSIKEKTILDDIESIKSQTAEKLMSGIEIIEKLSDKQFTYEWLSKNDPHNSIIGLLCSCCSSISEKINIYGKSIAEASVIAHDVQNLVVRDATGEIIAKGAVYVNKSKGYAVINTFELNKKYKENMSSVIEDNDTNLDEQNREMIFQAFQRGLKAFVEEYDRQNPKRPLMQINIGIRNNKLQKQVERFKKATQNLTVPYSYDFADADYSRQYVLYQRVQKQINDGDREK